MSRTGSLDGNRAVERLGDILGRVDEVVAAYGEQSGGAKSRRESPSHFSILSAFLTQPP
jgi:hypothetical protein